MVVALKKWKLTINEVHKIIRAPENNPNVLRNETAKWFLVLLSLLFNIII
jgi:hypothetical protein